jgi:hypothetical protein
MISEKVDLIERIEYYIGHSEEEIRFKNLFSEEERELLYAMSALEQVKVAMPEKKAKDVNEEVEFFLERVDIEKEISLCLKQKVMNQFDLLLKKGSAKAWMEIMTWYNVLKKKGLIVNSYWEFQVLEEMLKIFKEEVQNIGSREIFVFEIHSMKELTEIYFRMVFMVRRMAYGLEVTDEVLGGYIGRELFPVFIKVLAEDNNIEIYDRENILDGLSGWGKSKNDNG